MSARLVRRTIRQWAAEVFTVPFFDTINLVQRPTPDAIWASVDFDPTNETRLSFCDDQEDSGLADFIFAGPPGVGDDSVLEAAELCVGELLKKRDPSGALVLLYAHQPEEFSSGSADHFYRVFVGVEYRYYHRPT
jgi:hypothetical protein